MKHFRSPQRPKKSALIGGKHALLSALREGVPLERIYIQIGAPGTDELEEAARTARVPLSRVPADKLRTYNLPDHGGFIGLKAKVQYLELQDVIDSVVADGRVPLFLILDGITDIRNIGGIARTAFCTGVQALIIPDKGVGMLNEDAVLTSAGALEQLPVCRVGSLMKTVDDLHLNGIRVLASVMDASTSVEAVDFTQPVAIIMGSEDKGIYPALLKTSDERFSIPMEGGFESLNVSVATGIILYEAMKQRRKG